MQNNNRYSKYVALVALLIAIVGVSLGFAAYSNTVTIKAAADYRTDPNKTVVDLSTDPDGQDDGPVTPTTTGGATAEDADLTDDTIENIMVHFTAPNQSATYSFYGVSNEFVAYLNSIVVGSKTCTAAANANGTTTTASLIADACEDIHMTISVGSHYTSETESSIDGVSVPAESNVPITVTIEYAENGALADGNFDVAFGDSTISFGTTD